MRATSSIRSSSIVDIETALGGVALPAVGVRFHAHAKCGRMRSTSASATAMPSTRASRARRSAHGACSAADRLRAPASSIGPALPPAIAGSAVGRALHRDARQFRIDAALEAMRGIGVQAELARAAHDRRRREMRGFEEDVARRIGDARIVAAHDAGEGEGLSAVGDRREIGSTACLRCRRAISAFRQRAHGARRWRRASFAVVERMHRLAEFQHHVLGDVDEGADGRMPARRKRSAIHNGVVRRGIDAFDDAADR